MKGSKEMANNNSTISRGTSPSKVIDQAAAASWRANKSGTTNAQQALANSPTKKPVSTSAKKG